MKIRVGIHAIHVVPTCPELFPAFLCLASVVKSWVLTANGYGNPFRAEGLLELFESSRDGCFAREAAAVGGNAIEQDAVPVAHDQRVAAAGQ